MDPLSLDTADQFRPQGRPTLHSKKWAREYNDVKQIGSTTSTTRTAEQTLAARFWNEAPVQQARGGFRKFVLDRSIRRRAYARKRRSGRIGSSRRLTTLSVQMASAGRKRSRRWTPSATRTRQARVPRSNLCP